ncbi:Peptide methionine sulfoxide reductase MsrB [Roseivivax sp. THAF40]|uniref:peptide-methionine (R)-S-oxide reductase MsrB n=1 Tax=unclassified Roseivivax TaxID=2639302 RepID=UPI0012685AC6|nr:MULTISPECIES: peptide-methionine (R)-S-oxide reductase MsrB [unclassified Roseivivax]QFS82315.1 Peptide methionine sulfoxide reductase MsrB [Roseivivax sp. THAF197b]QFT46106.1 Peptide methionine sulfoxide reductase MsrB [Roseivivax sp. THAF40]
MHRRTFLGTTAAALGLGTSASAVEGNFEVTRSEAEWRAMLSDLEYRVMREEATERAFTSPLNDQKAEGTYVCRGCDLPLYSSLHKYDSGTGWPSYWRAISDDAIGTKQDRSLFMTRTECHCARCGSHLGHIFDDGPQPTGKRHCINGVSLTFVAA